MHASKSKAHKIHVVRFAKGVEGDWERIGHVYRHGAVADVPVAVTLGSATPVMTTRRRLVVRIAGELRVLSPQVTGFVCKIGSDERDPSGLYVRTQCEHCKGKGETVSRGPDFSRDKDVPSEPTLGEMLDRVSNKYDSQFAGEWVTP